MSECCAVQPSHPTCFDDEIAALALQLEEIGTYAQDGKGKHPIGLPPDIEVAYEAFRAELGDYNTFLADQQLARSIGAAVDSDDEIIANLTSEEIQCREDHQCALRTSQMEPEFEKPPEATSEETQICATAEYQSAGSVRSFPDDESDDATEAGPSMSYAISEEMSKRTECSVCFDLFYSNLVVALPCGDRYCVSCLKGLFNRATPNETRFPVQCHGKTIPLQLVSRHMSADELTAFKRASVEFSTVNRVYCSNQDCRKFIHPERITPGTNEAVCELCNISTCGLCKNSYHRGMDCPDDPALRQSHALAKEMGWQKCFRCGRIVDLQSGCYHMTCRCKAEFCYICGVKWKNCKCREMDLERIMDRAEEIVDRDAMVELPEFERQRLVRQVYVELEQNHECDHRGPFERRLNAPRRGFRCEMCDDRHRKYILRCRHCFLNVCEDCRRYRV